LSEDEGVIDNRGEEVDGLDQGKLGVEQVDSGVVGRLKANQDIRIAEELDPAKGARQNLRRQLGRSTGAGGRLGQPLSFLLSHAGIIAADKQTRRGGDKETRREGERERGAYVRARARRRKRSLAVSCGWPG